MSPLLQAVLLIHLVGASTLDQKIARVLPRPDEERWLQIPWRTDVMRARQEAQSAHKPLFFWIMQGHPLGCV